MCLIALLTITFLACDDDALEEENESKKITVQFETATRDVAENGGETTLLLKLSRPAFSNAILIMKADDAFPGVLNTDPAAENGLIAIEIQKGQMSAGLKLMPIDNQEQNGSKTLSLILHDLPLQYIAGSNKAVILTVKDDDTSVPVHESTANFIHQEITLEETYTAGVEYQIHFSEAVAIAGTVSVALSAENGTYGQHYATEPAAEENVLMLQVAAGSRVIGFRVKPVANNQITGELKLNLTIAETTGSIRKGNNLVQVLTIKDDELAGKPRGYELTGGNSIVKRFYEYNTDGRISKIRWETYSPYFSQGLETYHYDDNGRVISIDKHPGKQIVYHWSSDKIIRSDEVVSGVVRTYTEFEYDDAGLVGMATSYHIQNNGTFSKGLFTLYLYFLDGNLYKSLTYQDTQNPEEPYLVSTKTYDNYIDVVNHFPMSEVLPSVKLQTKLATTYRLEEGELDHTYNMIYEYRPDGLPEKRIATGPGDTQTAVYHYY